MPDPTETASKSLPPTKDKIKKRRKAFQRRSKTGCAVCRNRKIKCDETRPACRRCEKSGFDCDYKKYAFRNPGALWSYHNPGASGYDLSTALPNPHNRFLVQPLPEVQQHFFAQPDFHLHGNGLSASDLPLRRFAQPPLPPHPPPLDHPPSFDPLTARFVNEVPLVPGVIHPRDAPLEQGFSAAQHQGQFWNGSSAPETQVHLSKIATPQQGSDLTFDNGAHSYGLTGPRPSYPESVGSAFAQKTEAGPSLLQRQPESHPGLRSDSDFGQVPFSHFLRRYDVSEALRAATFEVEDLGFFDVDVDDDQVSSGSRSQSSHVSAERLIDRYRAENASQPLDNHFTLGVFIHFMHNTAPCLAASERTSHSLGDFTVRPWLHSADTLWTITLPMLAIRHQGLLHAMLAISSMQIAKVNGESETYAIKHYTRSIKKIEGSVRLRTHTARSIETFAATLLLSFFEILAGNQVRWNTHLVGAHQLLQEMRFGAAHVGVNRDYEAYNEAVQRDLFWWHSKQDMIQAVLSGDDLLQTQALRGYWIPRGPPGTADAVYASFDHLLIILADICTFVAQDRERKITTERMRAAASGLPYASPPFYGLIPPTSMNMPTAYQPLSDGWVREQTHADGAEGYAPIHTGTASTPTDAGSHPDQYTTHRSSLGAATGIEVQTNRALHRWKQLANELDNFDAALGAAFQSLHLDFTQPSPEWFANLPPLYYSTPELANLRVYYHMARIVIHRAHPHLPAWAVRASSQAAQTTAADADAIGRIASGLRFPLEHQQQIDGMKGAYTDCTVAMYVAGVQFIDWPRRNWTLTRLRDIAFYTGWGVSLRSVGALEMMYQRADDAMAAAALYAG